jgi:hypothetical protein
MTNKITVVNKVHISERGWWVLEPRILATSFCPAGQKRSSEIRPDNMVCREAMNRQIKFIVCCN